MAATRRPRRHSDPYRDYAFRIKVDGHLLIDVTHVSALQRTTEVVEYREGTGSGGTRRLPGLTKYDAITLKRGLAGDDSLWAWAQQVGGEASPPSPLLKEVRIEILNNHGTLLLAYNLHRCWPSQYAALTGLEAGSRAAPAQSITLQYEGWDREVPPPPRAPGRRIRR